MPDYYVDPSASGANDGGGDGAANDPTDVDNWTDAWTSIQSALDAVSAGDIVYCRGTQVYGDATTIDVDGNEGTNAGGFIKFIGCNSSTGAIDGSRFILNVNDKDCHGVTVAAKDMYWFENIRITNTGGTVKDGIYFGTSGAGGWVFVNCSFDNCSQHGFNGTNLSNGLLFRCTAYSNGGTGFYSVANSTYAVFCSAHLNTVDGFDVAVAGGAVGCIAFDNTDDGISLYGNGFLFNCVADDNGDDGIAIVAGTSNYAARIIGCRITNQDGEADDSGLSCANDPVVFGYNFFQNNGNETADDVINDGLAQVICLPGGTTDSNTYGGADANAGYTNDTDGAQDGSEDFNLASGATARRTAISIPTS